MPDPSEICVEIISLLIVFNLNRIGTETKKVHSSSDNNHNGNKIIIIQSGYLSKNDFCGVALMVVVRAQHIFKTEIN